MRRDPRFREWFGVRSLVLLVVAVMVASCSSPSADTTTTTNAEPGPTSPDTTISSDQPTDDGEVHDIAITIAVPTEQPTFDPHLREDQTSSVSDNIFETLLTRDRDGALIPLLASDLPAQLDDLTWEIGVRPGVSFTNGTPLTAEVVAGSFQRLLELGESSEQVGYFSTIATVEAVDEMTVRFTTNVPDPVMPARLAYLRVMDPNEATKSGFEQSPVGTGPYKFVAWNRGTEIILERNPDYWGGPVSVEKVTIRFIEDPGTRLAALLAGEVDLMYNLAPEDFGAVPQALSIETQQHPIFILSTISGPTSDVRVRQAMNYAIDKEALATSLFGGAAKVDQCQLISPSVLGYNSDLAAYPYNPEKARELLAEANVGDAAIQVIGPSGNWLKDREVIEAVSHYWNEVGLNTNVLISEFGEYLNRLFDREHRAEAIFVTSSNDLLDPSRQLNAYYSPDGVGSSNQDEEMRTWIAEAAVEIDADKRAELYQKATARACDDAYFAFLLDIADNFGASERLVWEPRMDRQVYFKEMDVR